MRSHLFLGSIVAHSVVTILLCSADLDPSWLSTEDNIFDPETGPSSDSTGAALLSFNPQAEPAPAFDPSATSPFDPAKLPLDFGSSIPSASGDLFGDMDNSHDPFVSASESDPVFSDNAVFDNGLEVGDCLTTDVFTMDKSRVRRSEGSTTCPNPATAATADDGENVDLSGLKDVLTSLETLRRFHLQRASEEQNTECYEYTRGFLPWGVCSSGDGNDAVSLQSSSSSLSPAWAFFNTWLLRECTIGTNGRNQTPPLLILDASR